MPSTNPVPRSRAEMIAGNLYALLEVDITYEGWEHETGESKAFYVRGFSWFRDHVINGYMNITDAGDFIDDMKEIVKSRPAWLATPFRWQEDFGTRQFIDAASPQRKLTPKFHKAAEIIVLCEAIAAYVHTKDPSRPDPGKVYDHMRIEPAVSHLHGFDRTLLATLESAHQDFMADIRRWTGQKTPLVFSDMALGKSVTHKLARWTQNYITNRFPGSRIGDVDFRLGRRKKCSPSMEEDVNTKEEDLPPEARSALIRSASPR